MISISHPSTLDSWDGIKTKLGRLTPKPRLFDDMFHQLELSHATHKHVLVYCLSVNKIFASENDESVCIRALSIPEWLIRWYSHFIHRSRRRPEKQCVAKMYCALFSWSIVCHFGFIRQVVYQCFVFKINGCTIVTRSILFAWKSVYFLSDSYVSTHISLTDRGGNRGNSRWSRSVEYIPQYFIIYLCLCQRSHHIRHT